MPTYEYQCQKCNKVFEVFHGMSEPGPKRCSECKGKLTKLIGAGAGLIFKGSGFYITDYKKSNSSGGGSTSESKSESKTEKKSDAASSEKSSTKKAEA